MSGRSRSTRKLALAISLVSLTACLSLLLPSASWAAATPTAGSGFCAKVTADIQPHHPHVGDTLSPSASWSNCGTRSEWIHTRFVYNGTCITARRQRGHAHLPVGGGIGEVLAAAPACAGIYHVTVEAYHGGELLDRATRVVRVKP